MINKNLETRWQKALKKLASKLGVETKGRSELELVELIGEYSLRKIKTIPKSRAKFVVLSGASGVGKNEIAKELNKKVVRLPHVTSRSPRAGEIDGREYFFVRGDDKFSAEQKFKQMINAGKFLAYRKTYGDYRGISKEYFLQYIKERKKFFLERSVPAFLEFIQIPLIKKIPFCSVYILPSTFRDLKMRITQRVKKDKSLTSKDINQRLTQAVEHLEKIANKSNSKKLLYDLFLINPQVNNKKELRAMAKRIVNIIYHLVK